MKAPERIWVSNLPFGVNRSGDLEALGFAWNCSHGNNPQEYHHADTVTALQAEVDRLREALNWYADKAENCDRHGAEGDGARYALAKDTGSRARAALQEDSNG